MFFVKLSIWLVMFPIMVASFAVMSLVEWIVFLFNVPVDLWEMISKNIEETTIAEK